MFCILYCVPTTQSQVIFCHHVFGPHHPLLSLHPHSLTLNEISLNSPPTEAQDPTLFSHDKKKKKIETQSHVVTWRKNKLVWDAVSRKFQSHPNYIRANRKSRQSFHKHEQDVTWANKNKSGWKVYTQIQQNKPKKVHCTIKQLNKFFSIKNSK